MYEATTLIAGDLAFFYDRNGLWHRHLPSNVRIVVLNNHGGGIFDIIEGPNQLERARQEAYFLTPQPLTARRTAEDHGLRYFHAVEGGELKAQLGEVEVSTANYPMMIDPAWFEDNVPTNPLLHRGHPLVEIATEQQQDLQHPVERAVSERDRGMAQFWYNPYRGILRARVPNAGTDSKTLDLYNRVNDCRLPSLFATGNEG